MKCQQFRAAVGAEPNTDRSDIDAHAKECAPCTAYRRELQELDRAVFAALHTAPDVIERAPAIRAAPVRTPSWSIAAGILIAIGFAAGIWFAGTHDTFADQVIAHVQGEPKSMTHTLEVVSDAEVARILAQAGLQFRPGSVRISYAQPCSFRGHFAPHLVVQTAGGPVTVLVLPDEPTLTKAARIREAGFEGVVIPAPRGVLVLLARGTRVDSVAQAMLGALAYSV